MILSEHFALTHDYIIRKDGQIRRRYSKSPEGPIDVYTALCSDCKTCWDGDNTIVDTDGVYIRGEGTVRMAEYIELEATIGVIRKLKGPARSPAQNDLIRTAERNISRLPTETVRYGKWVGFYHDTCSECGWSVSENFDFDSGSKYTDAANGMHHCPDCGARMGGIR